ncbi:hypothetical protein D3C84_872520 [compost metagenome]
MPRGEGDFFPRMQMLLAVHPEGAIGTEDQRADQHRGVRRQANRHAHHRGQAEFLRQVAQRLQYGILRQDGQIRRQAAFVTGE